MCVLGNMDALAGKVIHHGHGSIAGNNEVDIPIKQNMLSLKNPKKMNYFT